MCPIVMKQRNINLLSSIAVCGRVCDNNEMASNEQDVDRCDDRGADELHTIP